MRYIFLITLILLTVSNADAKRHLLSYQFSEGQSIEYLRVDSTISRMLVGGLANNSYSTIQSNYSITHISSIENNDISLVLNFNRIALSSEFNGQATLKIQSDQKSAVGRTQKMQEVLDQLTSVSFKFRIAANGTPITLPELEKYCDSLKFSKKDKRTLELMINQAYIEKVITQTFPILPLEKVKDESNWQEESLGCVNAPYSMSLNKNLVIQDKFSFTLTSKGAHTEIQKSSIDFGNIALDVKMKASENGKRICNLETSFTKVLNYKSTINGELTDSPEQISPSAPPIIYIEKIILSKK